MSRITESARNEDCTIRLPMVCNFTPETTVLCHPNTHRAGKGKSLKAEDALGAYGCSACHAVLDGNLKRPAHLTREEVELAFWHGHAETYLKLKAKGLVK